MRHLVVRSDLTSLYLYFWEAWFMSKKKRSEVLLQRMSYIPQSIKQFSNDSQVCDRIKNGGWNTEWIEEQGVPFAYGGNQWAGYENKRSITLKVSVLSSFYEHCYYKFDILKKKIFTQNLVRLSLFHFLLSLNTLTVSAIYDSFFFILLQWGVSGSSS